MNYLYRHSEHNGQLTLSVINPDSKSVAWQANYPAYTENKLTGELIEDPTLMELGVMKNLNDVSGLNGYLKSVYAIGEQDSVIPSFIGGLNERMHAYSQGGAFFSGSPDEAIARIKEGQPLVNLKDDYRVQYRGNDKFSVSFPSGKWERLLLTEDEVRDYLQSAFSFAKGGKISEPVDPNLKYVIQSKITPDSYFGGITKDQFKMLNYVPLEEAIQYDTYKAAVKILEKYYVLSRQAKVRQIKVTDDGIELRGTYPFNDTYAKGGKTSGFDKLATNIGKKLIGKKVPRKFQKEYGKTYDKKDAMQAGQNIAGSIVNENEHKEFDGIKVGQEYSHNLYNRVKVLGFEKNTEDNAGKIPMLVRFSTTGGQKETQGVEGFKKSISGKHEKPKSASSKKEKVEKEHTPRHDEAREPEATHDHESIAEIFKQKYGVTAEELYDAYKKIRPRFGEMSLAYPYQILSAADIKELLPNVNSEALNNHPGNELAFNEMLVVLLGTPLITEIKDEIHGGEVAENFYGEIAVMKLAKPAPPKPTDALHSFASIVSSDELRPTMMGVYHDVKAQQLVATNAHILAVKKEKLTGKDRIINISKDVFLQVHRKGFKVGDELPGMFPQYKMVIPDDNDLIAEGLIISKWWEQLNGIIKGNKLFRYRSSGGNILCRIETEKMDAYFDAILLRDCLKFFYRNGIGQVNIEMSSKGNNKFEGISTFAVVLRSSTEPTTFALIMPTVPYVDVFIVTLPTPKFQKKKFSEGGEMENKSKDKAKYRIQNADRTFLNAGTGMDSWFTLEDARKLVNYNEGQMIVEHDGVRVLWEVLADGGNTNETETYAQKALHFINENVNAGKEVYLTTSLKSFRITKKTVETFKKANKELFKINDKGDLLMASGKTYVIVAHKDFGVLQISAE